MVSKDTYCKRVLGTLVCLLLAAFPAHAAQARPLVLNTDGAPPHSGPNGTGFEDRIVAEAFRRIGVEVKLIILPSERCLQNANAGIDDGNYTRIAGLPLAQYPNLIMVPEPVSELIFTVFTRSPDFNAATWADLQGRQVGAVTGWKIVEMNLKNGQHLQRVRDEEATFALLDKGRVEAIVGGLYTGREIIRTHGYQGMRALSPPLATEPMYLYLNKRHAALVPKLAEALRSMRRDGTQQRITKAVMDGARQ